MTCSRPRCRCGSTLPRRICRAYASPAGRVGRGIRWCSPQRLSGNWRIPRMKISVNSSSAESRIQRCASGRIPDWILTWTHRRITSGPYGSSSTERDSKFVSNESPGDAFQEPRVRPPGFGLRLSSGAFRGGAASDSGRTAALQDAGALTFVLLSSWSQGAVKRPWRLSKK